ncbi:hypothetical protein HK100_005265 [Physocladia obscura]|uniref:Uncharacterized protein n=1 Tax=Physocladia obscura TaxID=109957 RepID=A0AAD5XJB6_9FUNG|nr:hypothetical protein HK100_005265 [Physocladia obscura]
MTPLMALYSRRQSPENINNPDQRQQQQQQQQQLIRTRSISVNSTNKDLEQINRTVPPDVKLIGAFPTATSAETTREQLEFAKQTLMRMEQEARGVLGLCASIFHVPALHSYSDVTEPESPLNQRPSVSQESASTSISTSLTLCLSKTGQSKEVAERVFLVLTDAENNKHKLEHEQAVPQQSIDDDHDDPIQIAGSETSEESASGLFLMDDDALKEIIIAHSDTDADDYEVVHNDFYDEWEWETI